MVGRDSIYQEKMISLNFLVQSGERGQRVARGDKKQRKTEQRESLEGERGAQGGDQTGAARGKTLYSLYDFGIVSLWVGLLMFGRVLDEYGGCCFGVMT